jgi:hypothetical protein
MHNIYLVSSDHKENGKCNSIELHKIIEKISPEIIFEEMHPNIYDEYYKEQIYISLESNAIKMYLQNHKIKHIPVDSYYHYNQDNELREKFNYFRRTISENSSEYYQLFGGFGEYQMSKYREGFKYLNSDKCNTLMKKRTIIEENIINKLNNEELTQIYNLWIKFNDNRENEIINNIYTYSRKYNYSSALLIIGAAHSHSIMEKIQKHKTQNEVKLNWIFFNPET